jgi:hypothetical protein
MVRTDRTRTVLWGRSGNRCAIGKDRLDATSRNDKSVIRRTTAASSPHGLKAHVAGGQIASCSIIGGPHARLIPRVRRYSFWRE